MCFVALAVAVFLVEVSYVAEKEDGMVTGSYR